MKGSKFNLTAVIAIVVLLFYSYIVLMGLAYWLDGNLWLSGLITLAIVAIIAICVLAMAASKATRWKGIGLTGQIIFGAIVLVTLLLSSMPFAHFFNMMDKQQEIKSAFSQTLDYASGIDKAYKAHTDSLEEDYARKLREAVQTKDSDRQNYNDLIKAAGETDAEKVANLNNLFHSQLYPNGLDSTLAVRKKWLEDASDMSVWNIALPGNLNQLDTVVSQWDQGYRDLSSFKPSGYESAQFSYTANYSSKTAELRKVFTKMSAPTIWSIIAALFCFFVMMLPYLLTSGSVISKGDDNIAI